MKQAMPRTMRGMAWLPIFCFVAAATPGILQVRAQTDADNMGFVSIDCGLPGTASYMDDSTNLPYVPDAAFTDAGSNHNISLEYMTQSLFKRYQNVRSFPDGARNCYTIRSVAAGLKYIVRALFFYGNYDGLDRLPIFDLYIGVNFVGTVNVSRPDGVEMLEAIVVVPDEFVQVCLVNTGSGTPFISSLELRPLKRTLYPQANETQGLVLLARVNFGETTSSNVRYPDDPHDRIWVGWSNKTTLNSLSVTNRVTNTDLFEAPSKVMQTAITPRKTSENIEFSWFPTPDAQHPIPRYVANMHFCELQLPSGNAVRQFDIKVNGDQRYRGLDLSEYYLKSTVIYNDDENPYPVSTEYKVTISATANSTLPPIINAVEIFSIIATTNAGTNSSDVSAITAVKTTYRVQKNWVGDPCGPKALAWDGLSCNYSAATSPRITSVNLSFGGLTGDISPSFANLKAIQNLDLSHNNFTGSIPDVLSQLPSLTSLDLSDNQLNGSIPPGLLKRIQDGSLNFKYDNNPNLCSNGDSCQTTKGKSKLAVYISIPVVLAVIGLLATVVFCLLRRKKQGQGNTAVKPQNETPMSHVPPGGRYAYAQSSLQLDNRRFTYNELKDITNNFQRMLGQGGFGKVYDGFLEDGIQVAVKLRSQSSNQGVKEFLAEAQILARIHHKNLVSMVGYCKDGQYMALVYEYMPEGTLQEQIAGNGRNGRYLTWRQRLRIALESAQGLEYLHKGCNPPLIHRDVKATNILLDAKLEAKIADFGLSKSFNRDNEAHISTTTLVGSPGYVDPEYQATMQPTTKSDVYSFGVVLLELITAKPAIILNPTPINIIHWVRQHLARGNIEGIVDMRMQNNYEINSVWKTADIALKCTEQVSMERPTMTDVVTQLQDCLELEMGRIDGSNVGFYTSSSGDPSDHNAHTMDNQSIGVISQSTNAFEMEHNFQKVGTIEIATGPIAR